MDDVVVKVDQVSKTFRLPHEKSDSIKGLFVSMFRRKSGYEKLNALKDVSFEVNQGDFFAIVGRNGSGKSTLLKLLAGIYTPSKGGINVKGKLVPFIELGVGFNPELTGRENIFLNGALLGFSRKEMNGMYEDIVDFAELERFMDQKLKNYSSGMQVRLAFSVAIRAKADILLLDEVLAVGDSAFQQKCFDYFETLKRDKKTVIFVSHDMSAVTRFCNKAVYIKDGELKHSGDAFDIAEVYKLENLEQMEKISRKEREKGHQQSSLHSLKTEVVEETDNNLRIKYTYKSQDDSNMYIAFSVLRDGISVAELTTSHKDPLKGNGEIIYNLDKTIFNTGVYQITSAISNVEARKLLTISKQTPKFSISGDDVTRGAAMKLKDDWTQV
jgi:ABC-2 type transport system ATP-binding protein